MHLNAHNNNCVRWAGISVKHDPIFETTAKKCAQRRSKLLLLLFSFCFVAQLMWTYLDIIGWAHSDFDFAVFSIKNLSIELNLIRGLGALNNSRVAILG